MMKSVKRNGTTPTWIPQPQDVSVCELWNGVEPASGLGYIARMICGGERRQAAADTTENIYAPLRDA